MENQSKIIMVSVLVSQPAFQLGLGLVRCLSNDCPQLYVSPPGTCAEPNHRRSHTPFLPFPGDMCRRFLCCKVGERKLGQRTVFRKRLDKWINGAPEFQLHSLMNRGFVLSPVDQSVFFHLVWGNKRMPRLNCLNSASYCFHLNRTSSIRHDMCDA